MSLYTLFAAGLLAQLTSAYTVIKVQPFMDKNIDPIVYPGEYSKSHLHTFFGSDSVTVNTKKSSDLTSGCTSAENPNDLSVYWIPTVLYTTDGGKNYQPVSISRFSAYYNLGESPAEVAIPQDLRMVAGKATAQTPGEMDPNAKSEWFCEGDPFHGLDKNGFPSQGCSTHLQQLLYFPSCVNEQTLETAYKSRDNGTPNWCPKGMKSMPQLRFSIRYDLRKALPQGWKGEAPIKLASGNAYSSHGDFINGWTVESAQNMVATTRDKREFFPVEGKLGNPYNGAGCKTKDADPSKGTSNYAESVAAMGKRSVGAWTSRSRLLRDA
jgi:hypothetical protein